MTEADKIKLEATHKLIESQYPDILYAIPRNGTGMYICYGKAYKEQLPIAAENVEAFLGEALEVRLIRGKRQEYINIIYRYSLNITKAVID